MKNTLKILYTILLFGLFTFISLKAEDKHFLWEVKSETSTIYLLGSVHLAKEDIYPLDSVIENAFNRSDAIAVELDINNIDPNLLAERIKYQDGRTLEDDLTPELYQRLKKRFNKHKVPSSMFKNFKPWFAVLYLGQIEFLNEGYNPNSGIDKHFLDKAGDKEIIELEDVESQLKVFDEFDKMANEFVEYSLDEQDSSLIMMELMFEAWSKGDTTSLNNVALDEFQEQEEFGGISELLIDKRNITMAESIIEFLKTDRTYFVIVGAAHIPGDNGILSILIRENKYIIRQL